MNQESLRKPLHQSRIGVAPCSTGVIPFFDRIAIVTAPPNVSSQGKKGEDGPLSGSGTGLVLKGWATRSHWVRIAWRAPAHCPGPVRRYWYGVQGPKKTLTHSAGSLSSSLRRFGRTPICDWTSMVKVLSHTNSTNDNTTLYWAEENWPPPPWNPGNGYYLPGEQPFVGRDCWE